MGQVHVLSPTVMSRHQRRSTGFTQMTTTTARKTSCANCAAFDESDSTCHRHPIEFGRLAFPETRKEFWCRLHQDKTDESGWRTEWPPRDKLIELLQADSIGKSPEEVRKIWSDVSEIEIRKALNRLKLDGAAFMRATRFCSRRSALPADYIPVSQNLAPLPKTSRQKLLEIIPNGEAERMDRASLKKKAFYELGMSETSFSFNFLGLCNTGVIKKDSDGRFYR